MDFDRVSAFRTAEGVWQATIRKGPDTAVGWFQPTLDEAIADAVRKAKRDPFDLTDLLT